MCRDQRPLNSSRSGTQFLQVPLVAARRNESAIPASGGWLDAPPGLNFGCGVGRTKSPGARDARTTAVGTAAASSRNHETAPRPASAFAGVKSALVDSARFASSGRFALAQRARGRQGGPEGGARLAVVCERQRRQRFVRTRATISPAHRRSWRRGRGSRTRRPGRTRARRRPVGRMTPGGIRSCESESAAWVARGPCPKLRR